MSRRSPRAVRGLLGVTPLLLACGAADGSGARSATHTVEIQDMEFHPAELRVGPGDTIVWVNHDYVPHTATGPDSAWTSPPLAQGERWSMVASSSDAGRYLCVFHPVMEARLIVDSSASAEDIP